MTDTSTLAVARDGLSPAAQVIYNAVRFDGGTVPFGAVWQALEQTGHDAHGELGWQVTAWTNVYMWTGVNADFIGWMRELTEPDILHMEPVSLLEYGYDGLPIPPLPSIAVGDLPPVGGKLAEPHWLPVGLALGPPRGDGPAPPLVVGTPHALYRFYGADGTLLYIGLTLNPATRWKAHSKDKPWWLEVANITLEHFPDRLSVEAAERSAIQQERPRYNVVHNRPAAPMPIPPPVSRTPARCPGCGHQLHASHCGRCEYDNLIAGHSHYCGRDDCYCVALREFMNREVLDAFAAKQRASCPP